MKGCNSVESYLNKILPIYNPKPLIPDVDFYTKFEVNPSKITQVRDQKQKWSSWHGRTQGHMDNKWYKIIPYPVCVQGIKDASFLNIAKIGFTTSKQDKGKKLTRSRGQKHFSSANQVW